MYWGKVVRPAARKQLAGYLQQSYAISERRANQLVRIRRKALHYQAMRPASDAALIARLKALGERYPGYGYLLLHSLLRAEGLVQIGSACIDCIQRWACRFAPGGEKSWYDRVWR